MILRSIFFKGFVVKLEQTPFLIETIDRINPRPSKEECQKYKYLVSVESPEKVSIKHKFFDMFRSADEFFVECCGELGRRVHRRRPFAGKNRIPWDAEREVVMVEGREVSRVREVRRIWRNILRR